MPSQQNNSFRRRSGSVHCSNVKSLHSFCVVTLILCTPCYASTLHLLPRQNLGAIGGIAQAAQGFIQGRQSTATGGNGAVITMRNGQTFTYNNTFGGTFSTLPNDFSARAQSWSPALNEEWDWNNNKTYGVNVGGWLLTEPFIVPNLYLPYQSSSPRAVDEYTLSQAMGTQLATLMTQHYETFITEQDFANIAAAGMNWVRIPVPYWAIDTDGGEPYLEGVAWNYMLQAFDWARKYGLRVELDLHSVPGSQNGLNHSGRIGQGVGLLNGVMGIVNAQRTLNHIRILTELISRPEYRHVILFNIINEAYVTSIGDTQLRSLYLQAYREMRNITGIGANKGPFMIMHDGFIGLNSWEGFLTGADRVGMESHFYFAFSPDYFDTSMSEMIGRPCKWWAPAFNTSTLLSGLTIGGEWALAPNDCGLWLNAVGEGAFYDGTHSRSGGKVYGNCAQWTDVSRFSDSFKRQLRDFTLTNMDTFQNFFFWTWKTHRNTTSNLPYNPLWCYSCGLEYGYVPTDPRAARGACQRLGGGYGSDVPLNRPLAASMTGNSGTSSTIAAAQISSYGRWPPTSLVGIPNADRLPRYTATGPQPALPTTIPTPLSVVANGSVSKRNWNTAIQGCSYLNPYSGIGAAVPAAACTGR